ncbi:hypothetical protein V2J09_008162 [Rumex salicifolius]
MEEQLDQICWDGLDCCIMEDASEFFQWSFPSGSETTMNVPLMSNGPKEQGQKRQREQKKEQTPASSKACREKLRRDKLNEMFSEINSILHPNKPEKSDKSAILTDAMSAVNKLRAEAQELKQKKTKLQDEVKTLQAEKAELHEDKHRLKANKEKIEQQLNCSAAAPSKFMGFPNYLGYPMWQWISPGGLTTMTTVPKLSSTPDSFKSIPFFTFSSPELTTK